MKSGPPTPPKSWALAADPSHGRQASASLPSSRVISAAVNLPAERGPSQSKLPPSTTTPPTTVPWPDRNLVAEW